MSLGFSIAVYVVIWWVVLFAMLPIGVRTAEEAGEETLPGNVESAPRVPNLLPKIVATTIVSSLVFAVVSLIVVHRVITLDDIPFFPRYEKMQ